MAEEKEKVLLDAVVWMQKQQESLRDGISVTYKGGEYVFLPEYIDRYVEFGKLHPYNYTNIELGRTRRWTGS